MFQDTIQFSAVDGHEIFTRIWKPSQRNQSPRAVLHINHGMAEHSARYAPLAERLVAEGYVVIAQDHRGHGYSVKNGELLGHYADKNGWKLLISDVKQINDYIHQQYPGIPIALLGHSMGSFIVQGYMINHGNSVDAVLLSGSAYHTELTLSSARLAANIERTRIGSKGRSFVIDAMSFGKFNKSFKPSRTDYDWLSRDPREVDAYVDDPLCGFLCTNQMWQDLLQGLGVISKVRNLRKIPKNIPYLLFSGELDPMSYDIKEHGILKLKSRLLAAGIQDVSVKLFPKGRHEILNETNRTEVIEFLVQWLENQLALKSRSKAKANGKKKLKEPA